jgi:CopG family nickel-responsive transcriptional regulator
MRRITISIEENLAQQFDDLIVRRGYQNRSEAFRDLLRGRIENERKSTHAAHYCVASVNYIYDHQERELASRLISLQHDHHDICVSAMHVPLDHHDCLETLFLRGAFKQVSDFADLVIAQNGVRHGNIHIVPVELNSDLHDTHPHVHLFPKT